MSEARDNRGATRDATPSLWYALFGRKQPQWETRYCQGKGPLDATGARIRYQAWDKHGNLIAEECE